MMFSPTDKTNSLLPLPGWPQRVMTSPRTGRKYSSKDSYPVETPVSNSSDSSPRVYFSTALILSLNFCLANRPARAARGLEHIQGREPHSNAPSGIALPPDQPDRRVSWCTGGGTRTVAGKRATGSMAKARQFSRAEETFVCQALKLSELQNTSSHEVQVKWEAKVNVSGQEQISTFVLNSTNQSMIKLSGLGWICLIVLAQVVISLAQLPGRTRITSLKFASPAPSPWQSPIPLAHKSWEPLPEGFTTWTQTPPCPIPKKRTTVGATSFQLCFRVLHQELSECGTKLKGEVGAKQRTQPFSSPVSSSNSTSRRKSANHSSESKHAVRHIALSWENFFGNIPRVGEHWNPWCGKMTKGVKGVGALDSTSWFRKTSTKGPKSFHGDLGLCHVHSLFTNLRTPRSLASLFFDSLQASVFLLSAASCSPKWCGINLSRWLRWSW